MPGSRNNRIRRPHRFSVRRCRAEELCLFFFESGVLEKYNVRVLGTPVQAIKDTEDRELFVKKIFHLLPSLERFLDQHLG